MIQISELSFNYADGNSELNNINMNINKGEFVLLTGMSGSGKTTIIRLINGLIPSYYEGTLKGDVSISPLGNLNNVHISDISQKVSTVFQNPKSQFFNLDTTSELLFYLENIGTPREEMRQKLEECANIFNIEHLLGKEIHSLSGGEKQIIQIAASYISGTDIILLDEPTSNLDIKSILKVRDMLKLLKDMGKTILVSEHRLYFLKGLVDKVYYLEAGKIEKVFTGEELFSLDNETRIKLGLRKLNIIEGISPNHFNEKESGANSKAEFLKIDHLSFKWSNAEKKSLDVNDLQLPLGKVIALIGKNGHGKSTFAQSLTGLLKAKGKVHSKSLLAIHNSNRDERISRKERLTLSYLVMQDVGYQLFTDSVDNEISLGSKVDLTLKKAEAIAAMNLEEFIDCHPQGLSGGQKQRVSIAAGICSGSKIIIFDEPTSGMDYYHMKKTAEYIRSILNPDMALIVITHDMEFLEMVADQIMIMQNGKIVPPDTLCEKSYRRAYEILSS